MKDLFSPTTLTDLKAFAEAATPAGVVLGVIATWVKGRQDRAQAAETERRAVLQGDLDNCRVALAKAESDRTLADEARDLAVDAYRAIKAELDLRNGSLLKRGFADAGEAFVWIDERQAAELADWREMNRDKGTGKTP